MKAIVKTNPEPLEMQSSLRAAAWFPVGKRH